MNTELVKKSSSYINGSWVLSNEKILIKNPADPKKYIGEIYFASPQNAKDSIVSASNAFKHWKITSVVK